MEFGVAPAVVRGDRPGVLRAARGRDRPTRPEVWCPEVPPPLLLPLLLQAARAVTPAVTTAVAVPALIFPKLITYLPDLDSDRGPFGVKSG